MGVEWDTSKLDSKIRKLLAQLNAASRRSLLSKLAVQTENGLNRNMDIKQDSNSIAWLPLAESTINRRRNKNKGEIKILEDTGKLREWSHIVESATKARVGTTVEYGVFHNYGPTQFDVNFPQREWAYVSGDTEIKLIEVIKRHLKGI